MKITESKQRRLRHYMDAPKRFLRRARDFYVDSLVSFDGRLGVVTCPATNTSRLTKNFGSNRLKDDDNHDKLERMYRSMCERLESDRVGCFRERERGNGGYGGMERSYSIALGKIGTIDEDEQCEFEENVKIKNDMFLRTRSHAVSRINYGFH